MSGQLHDLAIRGRILNIIQHVTTIPRHLAELEGFADQIMAVVYDGGPDTSRCLASIAAERRRQIETKGWTVEHDDSHAGGEIADAAADFASTGQQPIARSWAYVSKVIKRESRREQLVKAGALIVAELERTERAVGSKQEQSA